MTESEFKRQVWRAFDTVEIEGVAQNARVVAVHFPKLQIRASIAPGVTDWFGCDIITSHKSATAEPDDIAIIADLHEKYMKQLKRNEDLQAILDIANNKIKELNIKLNNASEVSELKKLRKSILSIDSTMGSIKHRVEQIDEYLTSIGIISDEESK